MVKREKLPEEKISSIEKKKRIVIEDAKPKQIKEWVIYLWRDDDIYYATSKVRGQLYGQGFRIEKDPEHKDTEKRRFWLARRNAVTFVENTLNALHLYGKKATNQGGNIDWEQLKYQERLHAWFSALRKTRKFPIVEITPSEAFKMKLI